MDSALVEGTEAETLAWLVRALERAHVRGQTKLVSYFEAVKYVEGKYDSKKTLERFFGDATDLYAVRDDLVRVVRDDAACQVSLWLHHDSAPKKAISQ